MRVVRLGTDAYPIWDGSGAAVRGGRWNPTGFPVIYAAGSLSLAMLEFLAQGKDFDRTFLVDADIPDNIAIDDLMAQPPPNWRELDSPAALRAGRDWLAARLYGGAARPIRAGASRTKLRDQSSPSRGSPDSTDGSCAVGLGSATAPARSARMRIGSTPPGPSHLQPFTAAAVSPFTKYRWKNTNSAAIGNVATVEAAIAAPHIGSR